MMERTFMKSDKNLTSSTCNFSDHSTSGHSPSPASLGVASNAAVAAAARHYSSLYAHTVSPIVSTTISSDDLVTSGGGHTSNLGVSDRNVRSDLAGNGKFLSHNLATMHPLSMAAAAVYESQYRNLTTKQWSKYSDTPSPGRADGSNHHQLNLEHSQSLLTGTNGPSSGLVSASGNHDHGHLFTHSATSNAYATPPPAHSSSTSVSSVAAAAARHHHHHHHYLSATGDSFSATSGGSSYLISPHLSQAALAAAASASNSASTGSSSSSSGFGHDSFPTTSGIRKFERRLPNSNRISPAVKASDEYKLKRERNNIAVRKSREKSKRRQKDNETRAQELIAENEVLRQKCNVLSKMTEGVRVLLTSNGVPHEKVSIELSKVIQDLQDHSELDSHGPGSNQSSGLLGVQHEFSFPLTSTVTGSSHRDNSTVSWSHHFGHHLGAASPQMQHNSSSVAAAAAAVAAGHVKLPVGAAAAAAAAAASAAAGVGQSMHHPHLQHQAYHSNAAGYH